MKQKFSPRILLSFAAKHYPKLYGVMWSLYVIMASSFLLSHVTKREIHNATVIFSYLEFIVFSLTLFTFFCHQKFIKQENLRTPSQAFYQELIVLLAIFIEVMLMLMLTVLYNTLIGSVFGLWMIYLTVDLHKKYVLSH